MKVNNVLRRCRFFSGLHSVAAVIAAGALSCAGVTYAAEEADWVVDGDSVEVYGRMLLKEGTLSEVIGEEKNFGSIAVGKRADLVITDTDLNIESVYVKGKKI